MLKGYQRKLVMIRTKDSSIFESAFFILRSTALREERGGDMITEANRILEDNDQKKKRPRSFSARHIFISLGIGFALGSALVGTVWICVLL